MEVVEVSFLVYFISSFRFGIRGSQRNLDSRSQREKDSSRMGTLSPVDERYCDISLRTFV